jgi:hypothetical protein
VSGLSDSSSLHPLKPSFQIGFRPSAYLISLVRTFVADFYQKVVNDPVVASQLALTTHELLENAAKYSTDGATKLFVEVDPEAGTVLVQTKNRAAEPQVESLKRWFDELAAAPDVSVLYEEMVRRTAVKRSGSGGLGLVRIMGEGDMEMDLSVDGDRVVISARGRIRATS